MDTYSTLDDRGDSTALHDRHRAYHEAGHLWAMNDFGLRIRWANLNDCTPQTSEVPGAMEWFSANALTAHAMSVEIDLMTDLGYQDMCDVDVVSCWEHALDLVEDICCCQRGGDERGLLLVETPQKMYGLVDRLLANWHGIDTLAKALLTGLDVKGGMIRQCLNLRGPRIP